MESTYAAVATTAFIFLLLSMSDTRASESIATPAKFLASCEIDIDRNKEPDLALVIETVRGQELIVLLRNESSYAVVNAAIVPPPVQLLCKYGATVKGTRSAKSKLYQTGGTYLEVVQPEGGAFAYFWSGKELVKVWIAD